MREPETCARCGHTTQGCERCGVTHPFLGSSINGQTYCHTWQTIAEHLRRPYVPTCYEAASHELWADAGGRWLGTA
jgi:hypothetical protein